MENYELAFRMQAEVPEVIDLAKEPRNIHELYGLDDEVTAPFGRQCLMARRLVESGVRFVQIFSGGWDSHDYLERGHSARIRSVDKPIAALIKDLKTRGMRDDTLVIWTGEFGRTPDNNKRGGVYAFAHIRGGGEYGDTWHLDGMLDKKQNVFDDFIAAAEWLVDIGLTRIGKLSIMGKSNGGLLTAACLTQRPDLFGTVISDVPVTDMLRFHRFTVGRFWVGEYGNAEADPTRSRPAAQTGDPFSRRTYLGSRSGIRRPGHRPHPPARP